MREDGISNIFDRNVFMTAISICVRRNNVEINDESQAPVRPVTPALQPDDAKMFENWGDIWMIRVEK